MYGFRQEGVGWGGVEINLLNIKSKKKKVLECFFFYFIWVNIIIFFLREKNFGFVYVICILIKLGQVMFIKNFLVEVVIDIFMIYWD